MGAVGSAVITSDQAFYFTRGNKQLFIGGAAERDHKRYEVPVDGETYVIYLVPLADGGAFAVIWGERNSKRPATLLELNEVTTTCFLRHSKTVATLWMIYAAYGCQSAKA